MDEADVRCLTLFLSLSLFSLKNMFLSVRYYVKLEIIHGRNLSTGSYFFFFLSIDFVFFFLRCSSIASMS